MGAIGKATEMRTGSLWSPTYTQINWNKPPKMINSTSNDITFKDPWCNRVVAKQEDSYSITAADKVNE